MRDFSIERESLSTIIGRQLSAVTFIMDYLQLSFDGDLLTIYTDIRVDDPLGFIKWLEPGFRDRICGLISEVVQQVEIKKKEIRIEFPNEKQIIIPLVGPYPGFEAVMFMRQKNSGWWVIEQIEEK